VIFWSQLAILLSRVKTQANQNKEKKMIAIFQDEDPLLTVNQAAALLGIHRTSLYEVHP
jgi:transcriptional regulator of acetoin/glycerol metabolism